ncbi:S8 family serine peptidase [Luteibacter yeojuensis]|uniref:S8 family serine peptidase n=1 Tax=Luteibacter yeojuensis TaxID=345309 RepID=UPI000695D4BB|nr:S8 family serine peptidase [Luteibacter yeojuensis]
MNARLASLHPTFQLVLKFKPGVVDGDGRPLDAERWPQARLSPFRVRPMVAAAKDDLSGRLDHHADLSPLATLMYVQDVVANSRDDLLPLASDFEASGLVEYASIEPRNVAPWDPQSVDGSPRRIAPLTQPRVRKARGSQAPDLLGYQDYLDDPDGVDAWYAWELGVSGWGVRIADIEWGYNFKHADLEQPGRLIQVLQSTNSDYDDHGAAVVGVMYGVQGDIDDPRGIVGGVFGADALYAVSELPLGRAAGIAEGLKYLRPGDVFLYEMQTGGRDDVLVPPDFDRSVWEITKLATDAGIVVVATAGNGDENLDLPFYDEYRGRGDNGAIIVGAGTKYGRNKASFSTYGTQVHLQGWGDWTVCSAGYGDLYNGGPNDTFTQTFSGTSSAGPIVATAAVAIQSWYKIKTGGAVLSSRQLRDLMIVTGKPQGSGGHIGPLPNIRAALWALGAAIGENGGRALAPTATFAAPPSSPPPWIDMAITDADIASLAPTGLSRARRQEDMQKLHALLKRRRR